MDSPLYRMFGSELAFKGSHLIDRYLRILGKKTLPVYCGNGVIQRVKIIRRKFFEDKIHPVGGAEIKVCTHDAHHLRFRRCRRKKNTSG